MQEASQLHYDPGSAYPVSYVSSLPTELLNLVFTHYRGDRSIHPSASDPIWTLLHVCWRWRDIAQEQSSLWCRINTFSRTSTRPDFHSFSDRRVSLVCNVLERYLVNSHDHPLDIDCFWLCRDVSWRPVLELLWRHHARWRDITVRGSGAEQLAEVARASLSVESTQVPLPPLRSFRTLAPAPVDLSCLAHILQAPGLSILRLRSIVLDAPPDALPWAQITHYQGASHTHAEHHFLLSYMLNLESCDVLGPSPAFGSSNPARRRYPRLRALGHDRSDLCLRYMEAPMLEKLRSRAKDNRLVFNFLTHSGFPNLTTLITAFGVDGMGDGHLHQIIRLCPALRVLSLRAEGDHLLDIFFLLADPPPDVLPELAVLLIEPWKKYAVDASEGFARRAIRLVHRLLMRERRRLHSVEFHSEAGCLMHTQILSISREVLGDDSGVLSVCTDFNWRSRIDNEHFRELDVRFCNFFLCFLDADISAIDLALQCLRRGARRETSNIVGAEQLKQFGILYRGSLDVGSRTKA
ncbi:hypothetical protein K525DRAFT_240193 [Schizophyllum commune Loenen D]|nr:hypothetical protein K525DRAFT_240193 [Schizophyllum commune Loenen D]